MVENIEMTEEPCCNNPQPGDIIMTDHFVCQEEQKHEENQINTVEEQQKLETIKRVRIFKKLDSKLCIATMLGYFISWENL